MNGICYSFSELDFFKVILINVIACDVHVMFIWKVEHPEHPARTPRTPRAPGQNTQNT